jgi:hypothetical protein
MSYRVSTHRAGHSLWWWRDNTPIPADHDSIRPATQAEAALMDKIVEQDARLGAPPLDISISLLALMGNAKRRIN